MGLVLILFCTAATIASVASLYLATRRVARVALDDAPPVSVLKPLCGADDALEANLETFFRQRYPRFELVFGVVGDDPAAAVVRRLLARYPEVRARLVVHDGRRGLNPKVANLRGILAGAHELVVISDSNIAVAPDYLAEMVAHMGPGVGIVTSLFAGVGERSFGATLENLHLNGPIAASVAASQALGGDAVVVGKSVMFRRSVFEELGGMESVASVLAEDYVMGRMFKEAGYAVRLCPHVIRNVVADVSVRRFVGRQLRWALLRSRLKPLLYPFEPLLSPLAVAMLAALLGMDGPAPFFWAGALTLLRDAACWIRLRGVGGLVQAAPLGLLKEAMVLGAWAAAPFRRSVSWRGTRLRVSAGTRLYLR